MLGAENQLMQVYELGAENQLMQVYELGAENNTEAAVDLRVRCRKQSWIRSLISELGAENNSLGAENNSGQTVHIVHFSRGCLPLELFVNCPGLCR